MIRFRLAAVTALVTAALGTGPAAARPADPAPPAAAPAPPPAARGGTSEMIDGVAAVVGGEVVLLSELEQQSFLAAAQAGIAPGDSIKLQQVRKDVLERLIDEKVVAQEAARQGIAVADSEVTQNARQALENVRKRFKTDAEYRKELASEGATEADLLDRYKKDIRRQMLAQRLITREVGAKVEVSDKDVTDYFAKNKAELPKRPATVRMSQIVVLPTASPAIEDKAREQALALLAKVKGGGDFAAIARKSSEDPGSAANGGDLGWFGRGDMDRAFEEAVFTTAPGQITGPIRTRYGWHLIKVDERDAAGDRVHARHILVRVTPSATDVAKAKKKIEDLRARIRKGEGFAALASAYSMDPASKDRGGDLGEVPVTQLTPALRGVIDSLKAGQVSRVMGEEDVFYLFTVTDRKPEADYTFEEIKDDLRDLVRQEKMQGVYDRWVKGLRAKTFIEVKPRAMG